MTHDPLTLEQYFHEIVNKPIEKEYLTMFDQFKIAVANAQSNFMSLWAKPVAFVEDEKHTLMEDDYWAFEMVTYEWIDEEGITRPIKHTLVVEPHDTTWMDVLDRILDELGNHYGYNIKEQVYYSVQFPLNELDDRTGKPFAGYGRSLNDDVLQQLLLAHPEVYETFPTHKPKNVFE
jgi:hypothetical protein